MTNITAMFRTRHAAAVPLLMLLVAIAAGCSSVSDEEFERRVQEEVGRQLAEREAKVVGITLTPTPTPEDESDANGTPNPVPTPRPITAEERKHINEVLGISTSWPIIDDLLGISTSWPTIKYGLEADYRLFVLSWSAKHCPSCAGSYLGYFNQYIATYVASQCDSGGKLTSKGFRDFLDETFDLVKLGMRARDTLQSMNALAEGRIKAGLTPVTDHCQRLILYPESGSEVALAQGLYSAGRLASIPSWARDGTLTSLESTFGGWLLVEDNQQRTIFRWYCKQGCVGLLP